MYHKRNINVLHANTIKIAIAYEMFTKGFMYKKLILII